MERITILTNDTSEYVYSEKQDAYIVEDESICFKDDNGNDDYTHSDDDDIVVTRDDEYYHIDAVVSLLNDDGYLPIGDDDLCTCENCDSSLDVRIHTTYFLEDTQEYVGECCEEMAYYNEGDGCYYSEPQCRVRDYDATFNNLKFNSIADTTSSPVIGRRYFGIELEVELCDSYAENYDDGENVICKHDGSLDDGFELNFQPMTLEYAKNNDILKNTLEGLKDDGAKSHDTNTCGLHIHVNRESFSNNAHISRLCLFVSVTKNLSKLISRRHEKHYADYIENGSMREYQSKGKYSAINILTNTIEFRIFKGTLKYSTIMARIEYIDALIEFTKNKQSLNCAMDEANFIKRFEKFLINKNYNFLKDFLKDAKNRNLEERYSFDLEQLNNFIGA